MARLSAKMEEIREYSYLPTLKRVDPVSCLPVEMIFEILSHLERFSDLSRWAQVSSQWYAFTYDKLRIHKPFLSKAIGPKKWATYLGEVGPIPSLPKNILSILKSPCPFFKGSTVGETHQLILIPATVEGKNLTLDEFKKLIRSPKNGGHAASYNYYPPCVRDNFGLYSKRRSYWALVTKNVLPLSRKKSYDHQQNIVKKYKNYRVPAVLEMVVSILFYYTITKNRLYGQNPWTFSRCKERVNNKFPILVGGFGSDGIHITCIGQMDLKRFGMGAVRRFHYESFISTDRSSQLSPK